MRATLVAWVVTMVTVFLAKTAINTAEGKEETRIVVAVEYEAAIKSITK